MMKTKPTFVSPLCAMYFLFRPAPPPPQSENKTTSVWRKSSAESASTAVDSQKHPSIIMPNTLNFALQKSRRFELDSYDSYKQQEKKTLTQETPDPTYSAACCFTTSALRHEVSSVGSRTVPAAGWKYVKSSKNHKDSGQRLSKIYTKY